MKLPENLELAQCESAPIFHVDDDEHMVNIVRRYYRKSSLANPYIAFSTGDLFLAELRKLKEAKEEFPLLVLLDINMPGKDGFQVLEEMRRYDEFSTIPLCSMLSSSTYEADITKSKELGANGYIVKPDDARDYMDFFNQISSVVHGHGGATRHQTDRAAV